VLAILARLLARPAKLAVLVGQALLRPA